MLKAYNFCKIIFPLIILVSVTKGKKPDVLSEFVDNHLVVVEGKMKDSPKLWMDLKEGYSRHETIYFSNLIMDSLDNGLSGYLAAIRHLPKVENLRRKSFSGETFDYLLKEKKKENFIENYFSTSLE
jgi:hypothetical protein|tara:strand:+ start:2356 stop:2736 length:381 start_codon:yes stop_codon:yes gene_type:complete